MKNFIEILIFFIILSLPSWAQIQNSLFYNFAPIKSAKYIDNTLWLAYELGCNASKVGIFVKSNAQKEVSLGVFVKQAPIRCASMPKIIFEPIRFLNLNKIKKIKVINSPTMQSKFITFAITDIRIIKKGKENVLAFVNEVKCVSDQLGVLIEDSPNRLNIYYVESKIDSKITNTLGKCSKSYKATYTNFFNLDYIIPKLANNLERTNINHEYLEQKNLYLYSSFKIKPVANLKIGQNSITAFIRHNCNEFPIGLFIPLSVRSNLIKLGALFFEIHNNKQCAKKTLYKTLKFTDIKFKSGYTIKSISKDISFLFKLNFALPTKLYLNQDKGIALGYLDSCNTNLGIILTKDSYNHTTLGVLQKKSSNLICYKNVTELKLSLKHLIKSQPTFIYPLRFMNFGNYIFAEL